MAVNPRTPQEDPRVTYAAKDGHGMVAVESEGGQRARGRTETMLYQERHMVVPPRSTASTRPPAVTVESTLPLPPTVCDGGLVVGIVGWWAGGTPPTDCG